jgi:quercetin dioxygenase-like cupin family protein
MHAYQQVQIFPWFRRAIAMLLCAGPLAWGQATSRLCAPDSVKDDRSGPACLLAHESLANLSGDAVYWSLDTYPTVEAAQQAKQGTGSVVAAFDRIWLFSIGRLGAHPLNGQHVADVGPIPVSKNILYDAEFLKSTFSPGMTAPIHVHSGPEAFYAVSGDTCLETPDGVQLGHGDGNSLVVRGGPPMLLMAMGPETRKGFALILHDSSQPPTTLVHDWTPKGLCQAAVK